MLKNVVVTNIQKPVTVISQKGIHDITKNRATFGLSFCLKGQITYSHQGKQYVSNTNNAILLPKGQTYAISRDKDGLFPVIDFDCIGIQCENITVFPLQNPEPYYKNVKKITELFMLKDKQLQIFSNFYDILQRLMQEQFPQNNTLHEALQYMETNISNPNLSNSSIAQASNISEVYFRKLFSQKYNMSPKQYILEVRIQKAKQLLTDSFYSASAIGEMCGFSSLYTFSRCFKAKTGMSPTEYASNNRVYKI